MNYRHKVPSSTAIQFTGDNLDEILTFIGPHTRYTLSPYYLVVQKPDGNVCLAPGDYICRKTSPAINNRAYACPKSVWESNMEPV